MSKELIDINKNVMDNIRQGKLKMRPKVFHVLASLFIFIGSISTVITSVFLFSLIRFLLRTHGPMGEYRLAQLLENFPWLAAILAILGIILGVWLIKHYDFSYKFSPKIMVTGFVLVIIAAGWLMDMTGLNDLFYRQGYMRNVYQQNKNNINGPANSGWRFNQTKSR